MLNVKPETLAQMDDKELDARKVDAEKLDRRVRANFSLKGILGWALGAAAIAGTLAFFAFPLAAVVLPVAAAITLVPPVASYAATFYTQAELKRITDAVAERKAPKHKIEVTFEDGTKSIVSAAPSSLGPVFTSKADAATTASMSSIAQAVKAALNPPLLLPAPAKPQGPPSA